MRSTYLILHCYPGFNAKNQIAIFAPLILSLLMGCDAGTAPPPAKISSAPTRAITLQSPREVPSAPIPWSSSKYFDLHRDLLRKEPDRWQPAVKTLEQKGDRFTLFMIDEAQRQHITPEKLATLEELSVAIRPKFSELAPNEVQVLLERATYADMMCPEIEGLLKRWTLKLLGKEVHRPEIRKELVRIQTSYVCDEKVLYLELSFDIEPEWRAIQEKWYADKVQLHSMNDGVKERAGLLLAEAALSPDL